MGRKGGKTPKKPRLVTTYKEAAVQRQTPEKQDAMLAALERNAMRGNLPSFEFYLRLLGQHPDQTGDDTANEIRIVDKDPEGVGYND